MIRNLPEFDQRIADWLESDPTTAPPDVLTTVVAAISSIPQARRGLLAPWRFPLMTNTMRAAAAVAIVAIVGVGVLAFNLGKPGVGTQRTPGPTAAPTTAATAAPTLSPAPSQVAPGITGWTTYTSAVYGISLGYPDGWRLDSAAPRKWQPGDPLMDGFGYSDVLVNPEARDGDSIGLGVFQMPAGPGDDITSREGLAAWFAANLCDKAVDACETVPDVALPMCLGKAACLPAILVPLSDGTGAVFGDPEKGLVTIVSIFRADDFPAAARYGGAVQLLKSILTTMDVWTPEPGQIPAGT